MNPLLLFAIILPFCNAASRPNIVVIMADDLGWNDVSFHGSNQFMTPNIDALAYSGVILNRHYTLPTCTPSRTAFMTGKHPIRTGMQGNPIRAGEPRGLPLDEVLLPQKLQELGYITHLIGKWHLGYHRSEYTPIKRGFNSHFGYWNGYIGYFDYKIDQGDFIGYDLHRDLNTSWAENGRYATDVFTEEAVRIISFHDTSKPLFLQVAHLAVHSGRDSQLLEVPKPDEVHEKFKHIQDPQRRLFAGMTRKLDDSVGEIMTALREKGILNNTIVIFLSDNGAQTIGMHQNWGSNWPFRGLKFTLFEGGVRCVAVLWSSLLTNPGRMSSQIMHITDWYPTIYAMAGGNVSQLGEKDGINTWAYLLGDVDNNITIPRKGALLNIGNALDTEGIIDGKWKLVHSTNKNGSYDSFFGDDGRGPQNPAYNISEIFISPTFRAIYSLQTNRSSFNYSLENKITQLRQQATVICQNVQRIETVGPLCPDYCLFDLQSDPCESENLLSKYPNIVENLKSKLDQFRKEMVPELNVPLSLLSNPKLHNNTWVNWLDNEYIDIPPIESIANKYFRNIQLFLIMATTIFLLFLNLSLYVTFN